MLADTYIFTLPNVSAAVSPLQAVYTDAGKNAFLFR